MTNFYFRAVASDGQLRTGTIHAETERWVAQELRRQGLTPVFVGTEPKKSFELKLPGFSGAKRRDVLFFTQELSTLLNAGVPLDRALSITSELTERSSFRLLVQDVLRVLKGGRSLADSLATHPDYFSDLYINMCRAGEASGSLAAVFERLSEFERTRDDLRSYIVSSMAYPCLLMLVGIGSILILMNFVVPRFASVFEQSRIEMPLPTKMLLEGSKFLQSYGLILLIALIALIGRTVCLCAHPGRTIVVGLIAAADSGARRRAAESRDGPFCSSHGHAGRQQCSAGAIHCASRARR